MVRRRASRPSWLAERPGLGDCPSSDRRWWTSSLHFCCSGTDVAQLHEGARRGEAGVSYLLTSRAEAPPSTTISMRLAMPIRSTTSTLRTHRWVQAEDTVRSGVLLSPPRSSQGEPAALEFDRTALPGRGGRRMVNTGLVERP